MVEATAIGPVFVAGATGRTGALVVKRLQALGVPVRALVRSEEKGKTIAGPNTELLVGDVSDKELLRKAITGCRSIVVATSATPIVAMVDGKRSVSYPEGGSPEVVDYQGQSAMVEIAKTAGIQHMVVVSSIGATQIGHFLNSLGNANILVWKYLAEHHLRQSGIPFTVVRPGGLTDNPGGKKTLQVDTGDKIMGTVDRDDVAEVVVQCLLNESARDKTFELIAVDGEPTKDFDALFRGLKEPEPAGRGGHP